ncbi:Glyoxalase/bleomycin resistance protein/dioxygenase [Lineolata rhizophorae]|uniref:Glyoxalase/bleomycin resistance protein/dioxygenase n=1 Tax=Lineolata rhizophorae TaxID=578093 RepID=A0A6A6P9Y0_9PEZI|nr:Glyoxalase/bleomycin resistance protein/dioxygenase [Lineolata rhizophorae]
MIEHAGLPIPAAQFDDMVAFFEAVLAPLGYSKMMEFPGRAVCLGTSSERDWWLVKNEDGSRVAKGLHFAFRAGDKKAVEEFYRIALEKGAKDNGEPGIREQYAPNYYAAFVRDPTGNNIEAVCKV